MANESDQIDLKIILRDENEELMNHFLTNGGKSIPITVIQDKITGEAIGHWGPRPHEAQKMVMAYKELPKEEKPSYDDFVQQVQKWYNQDKTVAIQKDSASEEKW